VASFRQYHAAYAGGHLYVWNVIFGLGVGLGGRGFGVVLLEQASAIKRRRKKNPINFFFIVHLVSSSYKRNTTNLFVTNKIMFFKLYIIQHFVYIICTYISKLDK
jgi:hypothetical protein